MSVCKKIRGENRKICIGDLNTEIALNTRSIRPPSLGSVDYDEEFVSTTSVFSLVKTKIGATVFDESNTERIVTHFFYIRFDSSITSETWIEFNNELYDIITVENLDQRSEFLLLRCVIRGSDTVRTNFA
jgi:SPP1 family predicted phage head-tail adaptor